MGLYQTLPRLTRGDVRELGRAAQQLDASAAVLMQSSWQGKLAVLTLLEHVKAIIAELYNRAEPAYLANARRLSSEKPQDASCEVSATVIPCSSPGTASGQHEG